MTTLDSYLRGAYKEDGDFLKRLSDTVKEILPLFYKETRIHKPSAAARTGVLTWPYVVPPLKPQVKEELKKFSASTHCMILFALDAFAPRGESEYSLTLGKSFRPCDLSDTDVDEDELRKVILAGKRALLTVLKDKEAEPHLVDSTTYGKDDPFTLTWMAELAFRSRSDESGFSSDIITAYQQKVLAVAEKALKRKDILDTQGTAGGFRGVRRSFLEMRRVLLASTLLKLKSGVAKRWLDQCRPELWTYFDQTIHRQISFATIADPLFDPAELAFAFEGALLLHPTWVGGPTVEKVFEALRLTRERQPYWRPVMPMLTNDRGHVLFPVSIEVANSVLRSCELLDEEESRPTNFSRIEPQLRTYAGWLLGVKEEIQDGTVGTNLVGWRTEYEDVDKRGTIHLWHTSHVLVFLAHYASQLKRKIAADALESAGLHVPPPKDVIPDYWRDEPLQFLAGHGSKHYAVLGHISRNFIEPRQESKGGGTAKKTPLYSMLLYGPPGTGKTTVAEQLAVELKRPLIIITVSDFLAAGAAEVENRAKGVFEVLRAQDDMVILFDEIDQFLLDRNSKLYEGQDGVFKFMTPGMLTKLQNLRDAENCIFIVATNYYERIDSAIKRRGRIDEHYLLSLPDAERRLETLTYFAFKAYKRAAEGDTKKAAPKGAAPTAASAGAEQRKKEKKQEQQLKGDLKAAIKAREIHTITALYGWGDLKNLVESKTEFAGDAKVTVEAFADAMAEAVGKVESAVSLSAYESRFGDKSLHPDEEFLLLLYLAAESGKEFTAEEWDAIKKVLDLEGVSPARHGANIPLPAKSVREGVIARKVKAHLSTAIRRDGSGE